MSSASRASLALRTLPSAITSSSRVLVLRCGSKLQIRNFHFGTWSSYLDPEYQKEIRHRQRVLKHKYAELVNRKLFWDKPFTVYPKRVGFNSFMCSAWRSQDTRPGGRWVNVDELHTTKEKSPSDQQHAVEDAEELSFGHRLKGRVPKETATDQHLEDRFNRLMNMRKRAYHMLGQTYPDYQPFQNLSMWDREGKEANKASHQPGLDAANFSSTSKRTKAARQNESEVEPEYVIDPITNRKVFKGTPAGASGKPTDIPVKTFKGYRSQFQNMQPPTSTPPDAAVQENSTSQANHWAAVRQRLYQPEDKPDAMKTKSPSQMPNNSQAQETCHNEIPDYLQKYEAMHPYGTRRYREPKDNTDKPSHPSQDGLKRYDEKVQFYRDGLVYDPSKCAIDYSDPDQKGLKAFDEKKTQKCRETSKGECSQPGTTNASMNTPPTSQLEQNSSHMEHNEVEKINEKSDPLLKSIEEYEATVSHPLAKTIHDSQVNAQRADLTTFDMDYPSDSTREALKVHDAKKRSVASSSDKTASHSEGAVSAHTHLPQRIQPFFEHGIPQEVSASSPDSNEKIEDLESLRSSDVRTASGTQKPPHKETDVEKLARRRELEADFDKHENQAEPLDKMETMANIPGQETETSKENKLSGNYVQDFPEEFRAAWVPDGSAGNLVRKPLTQKDTEAAAQNEEKQYFDGSASRTQSSRGSGTPRIETSLDRTASRKVNQESNEVPQNTDLIENVRQIYEDAYGTIDHNHRQSSPAVKVNNEAVDEITRTPEPTLYKILAYDPTMQSISTAETTSIVSDSSSPLTPAEVLLRLSNPAKFFPHFKPLQAQGYEIVSGSGDVLVFRKVRPVDMTTSSTVSEEKPQPRDRMLRNPIDGMHAIAPTGDFASPTGFVNHDLNRGSYEPRFKSNIDVRREEPVFSGKRNWKDEDEGRSRKKGRGRKVLVGAAWVAACSYAIGVVTDYFVTGGMDGKGPRGF